MSSVACEFVRSNRPERRKTGRLGGFWTQAPGGSWVPLDEDLMAALVELTEHGESEEPSPCDPLWLVLLAATGRREWLEAIASLIRVDADDERVEDLLNRGCRAVDDVDDPPPPPALRDVAALVAAPAGPPTPNATCPTSEAYRL